jgi:hypothetical protein
VKDVIVCVDSGVVISYAVASPVERDPDPHEFARHRRGKGGPDRAGGSDRAGGGTWRAA